MLGMRLKIEYRLLKSRVAPEMVVRVPFLLEAESPKGHPRGGGFL